MLRITILFMAFLAALVSPALSHVEAHLSPANILPQALAIDAPIPGYTVVPLTWEVLAFDNGTTVNLTGTIEQVHDQLSKINPDYPRNTSINALQLGTAGTAGFDIHCGPQGHGWSGADWNIIYVGYTYLYTVSGRPGQGPGPGSCGRVSCSYDSAIWWCNDNNHDFQLDSFGQIGDCAKGLYDKCQYWSADERSPRFRVVGQNFVS